MSGIPSQPLLRFIAKVRWLFCLRNSFFRIVASRISRLTASVPDTALYRSAQVLSFEIGNITPAALGAKTDDAVHVVAYLGDTTGNESYSSLDAQRVLRVVAGGDSGLTAYPLIDPKFRQSHKNECDPFQPLEVYGKSIL